MDMIPPIWPWARRAIQTKTSTTTPIRINVGSRLMNHELPGELKDRPPLIAQVLLEHRHLGGVHYNAAHRPLGLVKDAICARELDDPVVAVDLGAPTRPCSSSLTNTLYLTVGAWVADIRLETRKATSTTAARAIRTHRQERSGPVGGLLPFDRSGWRDLMSPGCRLIDASILGRAVHISPSGVPGAGR